MSLVDLAEAVVAQHTNGGRCKVCCQQLTTGRECRQVRLARRWLENADGSTTDAGAGSQDGSTVRQ